MRELLERQFKLKEHKTDIKTEIMAGITTFMAMAYILSVNPDILSQAGMDWGGVFTATVLSAAIGTIAMALLANYPFGLASGMGLNVFFTFSVVHEMGMSWQFAITAVLIEGIVFILLTFVKGREAIFNAIPICIKDAVSVGIGLFIALVGMTNVGLIVQGDGVAVALGDVTRPEVALSIIGIIITSILLIKDVKGAFLFGILATTLVGIPLGVTQLPEPLTFGSFFSMPPSVAPVAMQFEWEHIFSFEMILVVFTFLFVDLFDTVGTLVGVSSKAGMLDEDGNLPRVSEALMADAVGTVAGSMLGTVTVTTYVESATGVAEGGRTGLTALSTGLMFLIALFFAPVFQMVPAAATTPALVLVGLFMFSGINKLNLDDFTEAVPSFLTIIMMPFAYSIAEGITWGIVSFVVLKLLAGRRKDVTPLMFVLAVIFILRSIFM